MRRTIKKIFRYLFPASFLLAVLSFVSINSSGGAKTSHASEQIHKESFQVGVAKKLKLSSYNSENNTKLLVNAIQAKKMDDRINLTSPKSTFERNGDQSLLVADYAEYYESKGELNFLKHVEFSHSSGLSAKSSQAVLTTSNHQISGTNGVQAYHRQSTINGNAYCIETKTGKISVKGGACLNVCHASN